MMRQELTVNELTWVTGGGNDVLDIPCDHDWHYTGREDEGWWFFFWTRHEKEQECSKCHDTRWIYED